MLLGRRLHLTCNSASAKSREDLWQQGFTCQATSGASAGALRGPRLSSCSSSSHLRIYHFVGHLVGSVWHRTSPSCKISCRSKMGQARSEQKGEHSCEDGLNLTEQSETMWASNTKIAFMIHGAHVWQTYHRSSLCVKALVSDQNVEAQIAKTCD